MKRPGTALFLFVLLGGLCLSGCGSGGGNVPGVIGGVVNATFTPTNPTPGTNSISMQPGEQTGDTFQVVVTVTDIVDFFGAAFRVEFDPTTATFLSSDGATSFLHNHPEILVPPIAPRVSPSVNILAIVDPTDAGTLLIVATLENTFAYTAGFTFAAPDPVVGEQELVILTFRATNPSGGNAFNFDTAITREVSTCPPLVSPTPSCAMALDAGLMWNGGAMTAN
jgi:hypothetical protein